MVTGLIVLDDCLDLLLLLACVQEWDFSWFYYWVTRSRSYELDLIMKGVEVEIFRLETYIEKLPIELVWLARLSIFLLLDLLEI